MTPEDLDPNPSQEELTPAEEQAVRRLLAGAAADPPTLPADVAGRLDEVLAGLQGERDRPPVTPVTDLSERRARRWPTVLVAAAAVAVVGVGLGNVLQNTSGGSDNAASSADAPAAEAGGAQDSIPQPRNGAVLGELSTSALPRVRNGSLAVDAQRIYDQSLRYKAVRGTKPEAAAGPDADAACDEPVVGRGERLVAVRLGGERASILFRAPQDGRRRAEVYPCDGSGSPVLVTTVDVL